MPTRMPLQQMLSDISQHIRNHQAYLEYNNRLFLAHEGQLRKEIEDSLRQELGDSAYKKAIKRVPSINLLVRIIDKLSRVYSQPVERKATSPGDQALITQYEQDACVSAKMASANTIYNLHKSAAVECFVEAEALQLRVVPANQFLMYSDDLVNPMRPTVYIKFMDRCRNLPFTDRDGRKTQTDEVRWVQAYYLWSDDEFFIVDSEGRERTDLMAQRDLPSVNPLGRLPAAYINRSDFMLIPVPDTDTLDNTILIPKLLADLNYAVQFQSHSILVATDINLPSDITMNPDTVWNLTSSEEDKQGRFESIKPTVDIEAVLGLVKTTLAIWLESRNIQAGDMGQMSPGDAASGLARIIDESDATQDRQAQCVRFQGAEQDVWDLLTTYHNLAIDAGFLPQGPKFSDEVDISFRFGDQKPLVSDSERIANIKEEMGLGLMTKRQALEALKPQMTAAQLDAWLAEIDAESAQGGATLNGAQVQSLVEVMVQAGSGTIAKDTAKQLVKIAFALSDEAADALCASLPEKVTANVQPGQSTQENTGTTNGPGNPATGG